MTSAATFTQQGAVRVAVGVSAVVRQICLVAFIPRQGNAVYLICVSVCVFVCVCVVLLDEIACHAQGLEPWWAAPESRLSNRWGQLMRA